MSSYLGIDRDQLPWFPFIDSEKCTGCGACAEFCSNDVFELTDNEMTVKNPFNCVVGCDKCAGECPTDALSFPSKKDLQLWISEKRASVNKL